MPATSRAQWRKMHSLHEKGEITDEELRRFTAGVDYKSLPERKGKKRAAKKRKQKQKKHKTRKRTKRSER